MAIEPEGRGGGGVAVGAKNLRMGEDRFLALPEELQEEILTRLPVKDAIRTGALARGWRNLWKRRWRHNGSVEVHGSRDALQRELEAREVRLERNHGYRIDRFSLVAETKLSAKELGRFNKYAADCRVGDLHVESPMNSRSNMLSFPLPRSSQDLEHLSLRHFRMSDIYYDRKHPRKFRALEVIHLHHCSFSNHSAFEKMMHACPSLLTFELRHCTFFGYPREWENKSLVMPPNLRSLTIAECGSAPAPWPGGWVATVDLVHVPSLRSFRYSGDFIASRFTLPRDAALDDLYIQFSYSSEPNKYNDVKLNESLPEDLSRLKVLTISCNALLVASSLPDGGANAQLPKLSLTNLTELQLLMFGLEAANLVDFYEFLKTRQCPNLERLFVQLPASGSKSLEGSADEVGEEPPEIALDKLVMVKVMNFNCGHAEVQLVRFLLRKATSLREMFLVSPNGNPLDFPIEQDAVLKQALDNGKILLRDDAATRPYHSEVLVKF